MDALETTLPLQKLLHEDKMMTPFTSPHLTRYPDIAKRKADKGLYYWAVDRESYSGLAINKTSITAARVKNYEDLLRPEFKRKLGFAISETGPRAIGAMITAKGEEFVRKLKSQEVSLHAVSGRAVADLVASGEWVHRRRFSAAMHRRLPPAAPRLPGFRWIWFLLMPVPSVFQSARRIRTQPFS